MADTSLENNDTTPKIAKVSGVNQKNAEPDLPMASVPSTHAAVHAAASVISTRYPLRELSWNSRYAQRPTGDADTSTLSSPFRPSWPGCSYKFVPLAPSRGVTTSTTPGPRAGWT